MPRGVKSGKRLPFLEAVANEKSGEPLRFPEVASSVIRRRLFEGQIVTAEMGEDLGGTNGLVGACVKGMQDWGYEFDRIKIEGTGRIAFQLMNPGHEPVRKPREPGPHRNRPSNPVYDELREKLISGADLSVAETIEAGAAVNWLPKEVNRLKKEGYDFRVEGFFHERTFKMTRMPPKKRGRPKGSKPGKGLAKTTPLPKVGLAKNHNGNGDVPASVQSMLFGNALETPTPRLGDFVQIRGLLLDDDDQVSMVMRGGGFMWKTKVEGFADVED